MATELSVMFVKRSLLASRVNSVKLPFCQLYMDGTLVTLHLLKQMLDILFDIQSGKASDTNPISFYFIEKNSWTNHDDKHCNQSHKPGLQAREVREGSLELLFGLQRFYTPPILSSLQFISGPQALLPLRTIAILTSSVAAMHPVCSWRTSVECVHKHLMPLG